jgi:hypothetical protein
MNKQLITIGLCAAVFASLAAVAPRPAAATPSIPIPPPRLIAPDLRYIKLNPAPKLAILPPFLFRAELTSQIIEQPTGIPGLSWVICVVRNTGLKNSGPFQTLLTKVYVGTPTLPGPAVATPIPMNIPAGGYQVFFFLENAPLTVGLHADNPDVVLEYTNANNDDSLFITP